MVYEGMVRHDREGLEAEGLPSPATAHLLKVYSLSKHHQLKPMITSESVGVIFI